MNFLKNAIPLRSLPGLVDAIAMAPNTLRKQFITLARYGDIPHGIGSLYHRTVDAMDKIREILGKQLSQGWRSSYSDTTQITGGMLDSEARQLLNHPLTRGYIIALCTILPLDKDTIDLEKVTSYAKEINVMDRSGFDPEFDWSPFFGNYNESIAPGSGMLPNPDMARLVHESIDNWIKGLQTKVIDIDMSTKLLPTKTRSEIHTLSGKLFEDPELSTQGSLEYLYTEGIQMNGGCEVSQRWYTNGITPRTYFVAGPDAYNQTKYTKQMWNDLCDSLVTSNRRTRVNPSRIKIIGKKKVLFYDLTSFTSNLRCQRDFLDYLASYCRNISVVTRDTVFGLVDRNLGDIILEYNNMNCKPEYSVTKGPFAGLENTHGPAGFLGVYGNIATANFIHGAVLLQFTEHDYECGCAGDDAVIVVDEDTNEEWFYGCISLLGILATDKVYRSQDIDVVYLKRKTWVDEHRWCLKSDSYIQIPSLLPFIPWSTDTRFREKNMSKQEIRRLCANSLKATFMSCRFLRSEDTQGYTTEFLSRYYEALQFKPSGYLPQLDRNANFNALSYPGLPALFEVNFLEYTAEMLYDDWIRLPDRETKDYRKVFPRRGMRFVTNKGGPHLRVLQRMGIVKRKGKKKITYTGDTGYTKMLEEFRVRKWGQDQLGRPEMVYEVAADVKLWSNEAWCLTGEIVDVGPPLPCFWMDIG
jgi:hypothetical protein